MGEVERAKAESSAAIEYVLGEIQNLKIGGLRDIACDYLKGKVALQHRAQSKVSHFLTIRHISCELTNPRWLYLADDPLQSRSALLGLCC